MLKKSIILICINFCFIGSANAITVKSDEWAFLERGKVLQKSITYESRAKLRGSESKILINASPKEVWNVIDNKENLPKFIKQMKSARVIDDNKSSEKVLTTIKICELLPSFKYILIFDNSEKYKKIKFKKVGGAFKELFGQFEMIPYENKTIFAYRIFSDPGFYIPEIASRGMKKDAIEIMKSIKREAEK
jgi:ribosome-associated toxin RatA of RatAB toxin-antitoxin module